MHEVFQILARASNKLWFQVFPVEIAAHVRPTNPYRCLKSSLRILLTIVWFQKISIPSPWMVTGNSEGVGLSKAKILKENMKLNWNFQRGRGGSK